MSYTVYWNTSPRLSLVDAAPDLQQLIDLGPPLHSRTRPRVALAGPTGSGLPVFDGCRLQFYGTGHDAHESFSFGSDDGFGFCKTDKKPYDAYVKAALMLVQLTLDDPDELRMSCDGSQSDWVDGMILVAEIRGSLIPQDVVLSQEVMTPMELQEMVHSFHV